MSADGQIPQPNAKVVANGDSERPAIGARARDGVDRRGVTGQVRPDLAVGRQFPQAHGLVGPAGDEDGTACHDRSALWRYHVRNEPTRLYPWPVRVDYRLTA